MDFQSFSNHIPNLGFELTIQETLFDTISVDNRYNSKIFQLYLPVAHQKNPYSFRKFSESDLSKSRVYSLVNKLRFYVHTPFATNLSKDDSEKSINLLLRESEMFSGFNSGLVMHIGKLGTINNVVRNINDRVLNYLSTDLLLENAAGQGTELGRSVEEFRLLFENIDRSPKIQLCLDTQHLFASGMCLFDTRESVVDILDSYWEATGKYPKLIHLNDSARKFGSKVDRHETIGKGYIWSEKVDSLREILRITKELSIDLILETPDPLIDLYLLSKY